MVPTETRTVPEVSDPFPIRPDCPIPPEPHPGFDIQPPPTPIYRNTLKNRSRNTINGESVLIACMLFDTAVETFDFIKKAIRVEKSAWKGHRSDFFLFLDIIMTI